VHHAAAVLLDFGDHAVRVEQAAVAHQPRTAAQDVVPRPELQAQVMYGAVSSTNHFFGAGDLTGLDRIGAPTCL